MADFIAKVPPLFQTQLAFPFASADASFTLASPLMINGVPLTGLTCWSIDIGQPNPEYVLGNLVGSVVTVLLRNVNPLNPTVSMGAPSQTHRRGAVVKITDFSTICIMRNILNGDQSLDNIISYTQTQNFLNKLDLVDKEYVDGLANAGVIIPNVQATGSGNTGTSQVVTQPIAFSCAGNNRFLIIEVTLESAQTISTLTYNAVSMTLLGAQNSGSVRTELWGLIAPTIGTHNFVITPSGATKLAWNIAQFTEANQTTPFVLGSTNAGTGTTSSGNATTTNANSIVIHAVGTGAPGLVFTPGAGESIISENFTGDLQGAIQGQAVPVAAAVTSNVTLSISTAWANVIGVINGITSAASGGVSIQNNGVPVGANPATTLNLLPGLQATDMGGGVFDISASGGTGSGVAGGKPMTWGTPNGAILTAYQDREAYVYGVTSTVFTLQDAAGNSQSRDLSIDWAGAAVFHSFVLIGNDLYVIARDSGSTESRIYLFNASDLSLGGVQVTLSTGPLGAGEFRMTSNGIHIFINFDAGQSADAFDIAKFTFSGATFTFVSTTTCGSTPAQFSTTFAVNTNGDFFGTTSGVIFEYDSTGTLQYTSGSLGSLNNFVNWSNTLYNNNNDFNIKIFLPDTSDSDTAGQVSTYITVPVLVNNDDTNGFRQFDNNTEMFLVMFSLPFSILVTKLSASIGAVGPAGTLSYAIYSEDGQRLVIDATTGTISGSGIDTTTISPKLLLPGNYYLAIHSNGVAAINVLAFDLADNQPINPAGLAVLSGTLTIVADTTPTTINPTAITNETLSAPIMRFDA